MDVYQKNVEVVYSCEDTCQGSGMDADVDESGGKLVKVVECDKTEVHPFICEEGEEFLQVAFVGLDGIVGKAFFQFQVLMVATLDGVYVGIRNKKVNSEKVPSANQLRLNRV